MDRSRHYAPSHTPSWTVWKIYALIKKTMTIVIKKSYPVDETLFSKRHFGTKIWVKYNTVEHNFHWTWITKLRVLQFLVYISLILCRYVFRCPNKDSVTDNIRYARYIICQRQKLFYVSLMFSPLKTLDLVFCISAIQVHRAHNAYCVCRCACVFKCADIN